MADDWAGVPRAESLGDAGESDVVGEERFLS